MMTIVLLGLTFVLLQTPPGTTDYQVESERLMRTGRWGEIPSLLEKWKVAELGTHGLGACMQSGCLRVPTATLVSGRAPQRDGSR